MRIGTANKNIMTGVLSEDQQCMLRIIRELLNTASTPLVSDLLNDRIYQEMCNHAIETLIGQHYTELKYKDNKLYQACEQAVLNSIFSFKRILYEIQSLQALLMSNEINSIIIKGPVSAENYPEPFLRKSGDIDILVTKSKIEKAVAIMRENEYQQIFDDNLGQREILFCKNGVIIELHRYFASMDDQQSASYIEQMIDEELQCATQKQIKGCTIYAPKDEVNAVILLQHMNHHLVTGIGLRHVIDWMMFVQEKISDEQYELTYKELFEKIGLTKLAIAATAMCQRYLGLNEDLKWCESSDDDLCDKLFFYIMDSGNFGYKQRGKVERTVRLVLYPRSPFNLLRVLQNVGLQRHPELKDKVILKHFAWVSAISHFLMRTKRDHYSIVEYIHGMEERRVTNELLNELCTRRVRHL